MVHHDLIYLSMYNFIQFTVSVFVCVETDFEYLILHILVGL